jgi:hypothetical protein
MLLVGLLSAAVAASGFDWGQDCDSGSGTFDQYVSQNAFETVGEIPANKRNLNIQLTANDDVDIQLIDVESGHQIIAWPNGDLNGAGEDCTTFNNVTYCYSGYNGATHPGDEWIEIKGDTNRALELRTYGYVAGMAEVVYDFSPVPTCNEVGNGTFSQHIEQGKTVEVGEIPAGKYNVAIELLAANGDDVDIQLWDGPDQWVAWPSGQLNGSAEESLEFQGATVVYSGYNGINGNWGHERIEVWGRVPANLTVKAYGYGAGDADVTYEWGVGAGATCGGIAVLQCEESLLCKNWGPINASDPAGSCHTENWCASDATAAVDCSNLMHIMIPGKWQCSDSFTCGWDTSTPTCQVGANATYTSTSTKQCQVIRYTCPAGQAAFSNQCGCGCEDQ